MNLKEQFVKVIDSYRNHREIDTEAVFDAIKELNVTKSQELEQLFSLASNRDAGIEPLFIFNEELISFIKKLSNGFTGKDILIPWAEAGVLAKAIDESKPNRLKILDIQKTHGEFLQRIIDNWEVIIDEPYERVLEDTAHYDIILGCLPNRFEGKKRKWSYEKNGACIKPNYTDCLIAACIEKLKDEGLAVFIVPRSFLSPINKDSSLWANIHALGASIKSVIDLPEGQWGSYVRNRAFLIVITKGVQEDIFSATYSNNKKQNDQLLENLLQTKIGKTPLFGSLEKYIDFKGSTSLNAHALHTRLGNRSGLTSENLSDIVVGIEQVDLKHIEIVPKANTVYLSLSGYAVASIDEISPKSKKVTEINLDENRVNAYFFTEFLNHSSLGSAFKATVSEAPMGPHISNSKLREAVIYLPNLKTQLDVNKVNIRMLELQSEINEIKTRLWEAPMSVTDYGLKLQQVNKNESFNDWIDTLPFPLASVLWSYKTQCNTYREKYGKLLHFFEATTELYATLMLSVVYSDPNLKSSLVPKLQEQLSKNNMSLKMATFGVWLTVFECLAKKFRTMGSSSLEGERERILNIFGIDRLDFFNTFIDKGLISILKQANTIRNNCSGHSGAIGESRAEQIHQSLLEELSKFRSLITGVWDYYQLIIPGSITLSPGDMVADSRVIMGTRTPFERASFSVNSGPNSGELYLLSVSTGSLLKIIPFVSIMPSPKTESDACYFFNRMDNTSGNARFISYHYEGDPEQMISVTGLKQVMEDFGV
jgi:hypothetical protein